MRRRHLGAWSSTLAFIVGSAHATKPRDWSGEIGSAASRFRADTGATSPILYSLPTWSRTNAADVDLLSRNSAGLAVLDDSRRRFVPLSIASSVVGKAFDLTNAVQAPGPSAPAIASALQRDGGEVQRVKTTFESLYIRRNFAYSAHFIQQRNIWFSDSGQRLNYQFFRDVWFQVSSGSQIFDTRFGRLDGGVAAKGVFRFGAQKSMETSAITTNSVFLDSDFGAKGLGFGLDASLLWSSPDYDQAAWGFQIGLVGKDIGTTAFLSTDDISEALGHTAAPDGGFPVLPNDTILGFAVKLPNFRDGLRTALRLEWNGWTRPIPSLNKFGASLEVRFPFLASLYAGYRGGSFTGGVGLRFKRVELDVGSFTDLWNNDPEFRARRAWMMELRSVF